MLTIKVIILNIITTWFSLHPHNSKWWCIGAILNILFPVNLKDATCKITDIVSMKTNKELSKTNLAESLVLVYDNKIAEKEIQTLIIK